MTEYRRGLPAETPPEIANVEAEAALLGALMIDNRLIDEVSGWLRNEDFTDPLHERLYRLIVKLRAEDTVANPVTMHPYFADMPDQEYISYKNGEEVIERISARGYLAQLTGSGAALIGARDFAGQIRELAIRRDIEAAARRGVEAVRMTEGDENMSGERNAGTIAADIAGDIMAAAERGNPVKVETGSRMMRRVIERQQRMSQGDTGGAMCRTVPELNEMLGPLAGGQMTLVAGRPSMGKSVLAQTLGWGFSVNGHGTLIVSNEMSQDALAMRLAADVTHAMGEPVSYRAIQRGKCEPAELLAIEEAERRLAPHPFNTVSLERGTIEEIEALTALEKSKLERRGQKLEILIVDYVQIIGSTKKLEGHQLIAHVSARLLRLAKRLGLHVIALSGLNREVEKRPDKRPQLSDLRESGSLEADADNVLFVYREEYYLVREPVKEGAKAIAGRMSYEEWDLALRAARDRLDLIAGKARHAEVGTIRLQFIGKSQAIRSTSWQPPMMGEPSDLLPPVGLAA